MARYDWDYGADLGNWRGGGRRERQTRFQPDRGYGAERFRQGADQGQLYGTNRYGGRYGVNFYGGRYGADYFRGSDRRYARPSPRRGMPGRESFYGQGYGGESYTGRGGGFYGGPTDMDRGYDVATRYGGGYGARGRDYGFGFGGSYPSGGANRSSFGWNF